MSTVRASDKARIGGVIAGKYRVTQLLGVGGMGAVYEATNTWTGRRVAIKVLRSDLAADEDRVRRFIQEAQSATQIAHPHIVDVLDMGQEPSDGALFMVQELLAGQDLRRCLKARGRLPVREAFELAVPIMSALVAAHQRGVVHRDIKPENIFLSEAADGAITPKLIDFGISKMVEETGEDRTHTTTGAIIGTPQYMSPEQINGEKNIDGRTDVWSMGAVIYEMLAGRAAFSAATQHLLIVQIAMGEAPRLDEVARDVPREVADLVHAALVRERDRRYASMRGFLEAVVACPLIGVSEPTGSHRRVHSVPPAGEPVGQSISAVPVVPAATAPVASRLRVRASWLVAGAMLLALVVGGGVLLSRAFRAEPPAPPPEAIVIPPPVSPAPPRELAPPAAEKAEPPPEVPAPVARRTKRVKKPDKRVREPATVAPAAASVSPPPRSPEKSPAPAKPEPRRTKTGAPIPD